MNTNTMGIVFSNMYDEAMGLMTLERTMGSIHFGGRYRLVDFPLSGMSNAGIRDVGVITQRNYQSLIDHVGTGRSWDLSRKNGGLTILPPFSHTTSGLYRGGMDALAGVVSYIRGCPATYVAVSECDMVANMDFDHLVEAHREKGAGITLVYGETYLDSGQEDNLILELDESGRLLQLHSGNQRAGYHNVYLHTYIINKDLLLQMIYEAKATGEPSFYKMVQNHLTSQRICGFRFGGYCGHISSIAEYFRVSMDLLDPGIRQEVFNPERPVYTRVRDQVPCNYGRHARVENSLLADGCVVDGTVENSILFRGVRVGTGAIVRNSIVMQDSVIAMNADVGYSIVDRDVYVQEGRRLAGYATFPMYLPKGLRV